MIPIYEQGSGNGIGHGLSSFFRRFDEICAQHLAEGRAKSFAFIFYDFTDQALRKILKNQGVFAQLVYCPTNKWHYCLISIMLTHAQSKPRSESFGC